MAPKRSYSRLIKTVYFARMHWHISGQLRRIVNAEATLFLEFPFGNFVVRQFVARTYSFMYARLHSRETM